MPTYEINSENLATIPASLRRRIRSCRFIVAVTGAGISRASGIPLLRERVGGIELERFFEPELLRDNPRLFYKLYREILVHWRHVLPNAAHVALARRGIWVITQNIDGLHRDAGTGHLIEIHGNLRELHCTNCNSIFNSRLALNCDIPTCRRCFSVMSPGITLKGQEVRHFSRAVDWVGRAEILLVIGTRLGSEPVRQLPLIVQHNQADTILINRSSDILVPKLLALFDE